ncbi:MAG: cell division control protein 6-like protein [Amphiamblys sp. WSBS2006]|nr:MAG: cell division control protein 6-like protein [Amphiamblys sp. WSBS2006]
MVIWSGFILSRGSAEVFCWFGGKTTNQYLVRGRQVGMKRAERVALENVSNKQHCLGEAKKRLMTEEGDSVVGNEAEIGVIRRALESHFSRGKTQKLYIYGAPGTGKTATVSHVISTWFKRRRIVRMNCIAENISSSKQFMAVLKEKTGKKTITKGVVVIDELDALAARGFIQELFTEKELTVVGISNTVDLVDDSGEVEFLFFKPKSVEEMKRVVTERVGPGGVLSETACELCCRKTAGKGDVRRTLELCRKAIETCEKEGGGEVLPEHVHRSGGGRTEASFTLHQKIVLCGVFCVRKSVAIEALYKNYQRLCTTTRLCSPLPFASFVDCVESVGQGVDLWTRGAKRMVGLVMPRPDVLDAISGVSLLRDAAEVFK